MLKPSVLLNGMNISGMLAYRKWLCICKGKKAFLPPCLINIFWMEKELFVKDSKLVFNLKIIEIISITKKKKKIQLIPIKIFCGRNIYQLQVAVTFRIASFHFLII